MISGVQIDPQAVYDDGALSCQLGLSASALARARRQGRLRFTSQGNRIFYLGQWVVDWLKAEGEGKEAAHAS
jgi:hypothetical protein